MKFNITRKDERDFFKMQPGLPDRIVGLILPVLIDRRLRATIEGRWRDDSKGDVLRHLSEAGGPLGDAGVRVRVGFAIGLYDEDMFGDLKIIVKIRNAFAHEPGTHKFDDSPVQQFVNDLKLIEKYPTRPDKQFASLSGMSREDWIQGIMCSSALIDLQPRRTRFLRSIEIVLTWLAIEAQEITYQAADVFQVPPDLLTSLAT